MGRSNSIKIGRMKETREIKNNNIGLYVFIKTMNNIIIFVLNLWLV